MTIFLIFLAFLLATTLTRALPGLKKVGWTLYFRTSLKPYWRLGLSFTSLYYPDVMQRQDTLALDLYFLAIDLHFLHDLKKSDLI